MSPYAFHPEAFADLADIWEFLAEDNVDAADLVVGEILDGVRLLTRFPRTGHRRPDLTACPLRFLLVRDYLIAYDPDANPLWVVAVLHGRRNPRVIAAALRGRD